MVFFFKKKAPKATTKNNPKNDVKITVSRGLSSLFGKAKLNDELLSKLYDDLLGADIGVQDSKAIIDRIKKTNVSKNISQDQAKEILRKFIQKAIISREAKFKLIAGTMNTILFIGVNGAGKTTTIGKLATMLRKQKKSVGIVAADTFRAAAVNQLKFWAIKSGSIFLSYDEISDPGAVVYKATQEGKKLNLDCLLIDTAGRLHNNTDLYQQLLKIIRVSAKIDKSYPTYTLLVLDGTQGQVIYQQVKDFQSEIDINGLIITKLDGSSKGGTIVRLCRTFRIPIYYVGLGEKISDLEEFKAEKYSKFLVG